MEREEIHNSNFLIFCIFYFSVLAFLAGAFVMHEFLIDDLDKEKFNYDQKIKECWHHAEQTFQGCRK